MATRTFRILLLLALVAMGCKGSGKEGPRPTVRRTSPPDLGLATIPAEEAYGLAKEALMADKPREAIPLFQHFIDHGQADRERLASAHLGLASAYEALGHTKRSLQVYERVVDLLPHNPEAFLAMALAYRTAGKEDLAAIALKRAVQLDGDFLPAYTTLAEIYLQKGDDNWSKYYLTRYEIALQGIVETIRTSPDSQARLDAVVAAGRARDDKASKALVMALVDGEPIVRRVAVSLLGEGGDQEALPSIEAMMASENDSQVMEAARRAKEQILALSGQQ